MEKNSRKDSFDVVKCFAAFFVVQLHTIPATVCPLLNVIARLAVPLFFLITGYYYTSIVEKGKYGVQLKKIFLLAMFFYSPFLFHCKNCRISPKAPIRRKIS